MLVVLVGSLVFLASLFLPWQERSCDGSGGVSGLVCTSISGIAGRSFEVGQAAILVALILAACAVATIRPPEADRLPLGLLAALEVFLALAVLAVTRLSWRQDAGRLHGIDRKSVV